MWGKLTSLASVVTGQDGSDEEEKKDQASKSESASKDVDDHEMQLVEQQKLIIQLKDMIRDRENSIIEKDNELKRVSADYSRFKLQSKSKIAGLSKQIQESQRAASDALERASIGSDESVSTSASEASSSGVQQKLRAKLSVVRKQLQSKEKDLQNLNEQLTRKNQEIEAKERVLTEKDDEIKKLKEETFKSVTERSKESVKMTDESAEETRKQLEIRLEEMIAQLAYKDNKILELVNQISEREGGAMDLRECLAEKDEVIKGRDQAVAILQTRINQQVEREAELVAAIDRMKWKQDDLEENVEKLREELKRSAEAVSRGPTSSSASFHETEKELEEVTEMREKFLALLAEEKTNSASSLEKMRATCDLRYHELEGLLTETGVARDALLSRVEELEGLLESTTQDRDELKKRLKTTEEAESEEGSAKSKFSKFKALAGSKIKALEKEVETLKEQNNGLTSLRNRVTELEEEKGNLQLQIFDNEEKLSKKELILTQLDEMRQQCEDFLLEINNLRDKNSALEEIAKQQDETLVRLREAEKGRESALIRSEEHEATIKCLEARFEGLRRQLEDRGESFSKLEKENSVLKVSHDLLERKVKESNDEISKLSETIVQLKGNMESTGGDLFFIQKSVDDLQVENKSLRGHIASLQRMEEECKKLEENLKKKSEELEKVHKVLFEKNKLIEDASIRLVDAADSSSLLCQKLEDRDSQIKVLKDKLEDLSRMDEKNAEAIGDLTKANEELKEKLLGLATVPQQQQQQQMPTFEDFESSFSPSSENVVLDAPPKKVVILPVELSDGSLGKDLEEAKGEVVCLKNMLKAKEDELESLKREMKDIKSLQSELDVLRSSLEERNSLIEELTVHNEKLIQSNLNLEQIEGELYKKDETIKTLKSKHSSFDVQNVELNTLLASKDEMIKNMLMESEAQSIKLIESESALKEFEQKFNDLLEKSSVVENSLLSAQNDLSLSQSESNEHKLVIENLLKLVQEKNEETTTFLEKQQEYNQRLAEFDLKMKESQQEKYNSEMEIKRLEDNVSELTLKCESLKQQNDLFQESQLSNSNFFEQKLEKSSDDLAKAYEEIKLLKAKVFQSEATTNKLSEKDDLLAKLSENIEQSKKEVQELREAIVEKDAELNILRIISKEAQLNLDTSLKDLQECKNELETLRKSSHDSREIEKETFQQSSIDSSKSSSATAAEANVMLQQLMEELNNSKMEAAELREGMKMMEKKLLDKEKKIHSLSDILEEEEAQLVITKEELEKLKKIQEEATLSLRTKDEEMAKCTETLKEKEVTIKKYLAILKKQKDSLRQAKEDLNSSSSVDDDELKVTKEKLLNLEQELASSKKDFAAIEAELSHTIDQSKSQKSILDALLGLLKVEEFDHITGKIETLLAAENFETSIKIKSEEIESELRSVEIRLNEVLKEKEFLEEQLASQQAAFETSKKDWEGQILDLEASLNTIRDALKTNEHLLHSMALEKDGMGWEIKNLREERSSLEEKLGSFKSIYEGELNEVNKKLADEKKMMSEELQEKLKEMDSEHEQKVNSLISELESSQRSLSNFKKEVEVLTEKIHELKRIHEADVEHFVGTKQENEVENLKLASQISDITSAKLALEGRIVELTEELNAGADRSASVLQESQRLSTKMQEMEVKLARVEDEKDRVLTEMDLYKSSVEQLKSELASAASEKREILEKQASLLEQIETVLSEKNEVTKKLEEMCSQSEKIIKEKESFQTALEKVEVERLQHSSDRDCPPVDVLKESLESCQRSKVDLEREFESLKAKLSEKTKQNEIISKQLQGEMKKLEILETEYEERRLENQQMTETNQELQVKVQDMKKYVQESARRKEELVRTLERMSKETSEKDLKIKSMDEFLKKTLAESDAKMSELVKEVAHLEKEKTELLSKGNLDDSTQSDFSEEISSLKREVERLELESVKAKEQSNSEMKALQVQFDLLSNDVASYQHLISKLENNKRHLEAQMSEVKPMMSRLKEELKRQEGDKINMRRSLSALEAEKADLLAEIEGLRQRVKIAEDLEDNLELDYKQEVAVYREKLKEMEEALERSQKAEEELNEVNNKLLQHNNALIMNSEDLYDQLNRSRSKDVPDPSSSPLSPPPDASSSLTTSLARERDHLKSQVDDLRAEVEVLKNELKSSKSRHVESPPIAPSLQVPETVTLERLSRSSPHSLAAQVQEDADVPKVHSMKSLHSSLHEEQEESTAKSLLGSLSSERDSLLERLADSEKKFSEKEAELSEFYKQYQLLYQQFSVVQQHLIALQEEKKTMPLSQSENTLMVPYEKYKDLESLNRQLKDQERHLEKQLQVEQERRLEVEEGMRVIRDQYEQHRLLQNSGTSNESHSISIFSNSAEDDERRILPQDASLYVHLRHRCLQLKRMLTRIEQNRYSLGTIYRYRSHLWKFLIFYFVFVHLFILFRCWA